MGALLPAWNRRAAAQQGLDYHSSGSIEKETNASKGFIYMLFWLRKYSMSNEINETGIYCTIYVRTSL